MAKKAVKTNNTNTPAKGPLPIIEIYTELLRGRLKPVPEKYIDKLAEDWLEWSKKEDSLRVTDFFLEMDIHNALVYEWMKKYPQLKEAHEIALQRIASRREKGAVTRKYSDTAVERYQPMYDAEYKSLLEWRSSLREKSEDQSANGTIIVNMSAAPTTQEVKERNKE